MCSVLLPPGVNPIAVNKYIDINISYHISIKMYVAPHLVCFLLSHYQAQYKHMLGNLTMFYTRESQMKILNIFIS